MLNCIKIEKKKTFRRVSVLDIFLLKLGTQRNLDDSFKQA